MNLSHGDFSPTDNPAPSAQDGAVHPSHRDMMHRRFSPRGSHSVAGSIDPQSAASAEIQTEDSPNSVTCDTTRSDGHASLPKKQYLLRALCAAAALAMTLTALTSGGKMTLGAVSRSRGSREAAFAAAASNLFGEAMADVRGASKVRMLEMNNDPTPRPDSAAFTATVEDAEHVNYDGAPTACYRDESIEVICWKEKIDGDIYAFSDVKIAHPSQFRRKLVDDVISKNHLDYPLNIFNGMNGVVGMTADYCAYRSYGITVQNGEAIREIPIGSIDILIYDKDGNFTCMRDRDFLKSPLHDSGNVLFTFSFGPMLVDDYRINPDNSKLDNYIIARVDKQEPRAAIAQFGTDLHYLLCTVERTSQTHSGASVRKVAQVLQQKGVRVAYNMDGGQTAALMFNGQLFNKVAYGGQRPVSDILFFATAVPENESQR